MPGNDRYPKKDQNPTFEPGSRPTEQPVGVPRVPDNEPDVEEMTTDERMRKDPARLDVLPPAQK